MIFHSDSRGSLAFSIVLFQATTPLIRSSVSCLQYFLLSDCSVSVKFSSFEFAVARAPLQFRKLVRHIRFRLYFCIKDRTQGRDNDRANVKRCILHFKKR